jgi:hypothetical protein
MQFFQSKKYIEKEILTCKIRVKETINILVELGLEGNLDSILVRKLNEC